MKISGIYKIQSKIKPERIYIGSAVNIKVRWDEHLRQLKNNKHHSPQLQRHYDKYGISDLMFTVIEPCLPRFLTIREDAYFKPLPYFNCSPTAGSQLGFKHSEETKQRQSKCHKNISEETRKKMSIAHKGKSINKGRRHTEEEKRKIGLASVGNKNMLGKKHNEDAKKKMSQKAKGRIFTIEHKQRISKALIGNTRALGKKFSDETRRRMSLAQMGNKKSLGKLPWNKGLKKTA